MGEAQISMGRTSGSGLFQNSAGPSAAETPTAQDSAQGGRAVPPDTVASLKVEVTAIEFHRADAADSSDGWMRLDFAAPVQVDLMALPDSGRSPLVIASGKIAAGTYNQVRLFVTNPEIVFKGAIQLGAGPTFQAGVQYSVTIPSVDQTGIKTDASFTVTASTSGGATADVGLLFDAGSSLANVAVTGTGKVMLSPVIRRR